MSDTLKKVLRDEMFAVLNEGELTPAMCSTMMRLAEHARELLRARAKKPEDFENTIEHAGDQETPAINTETYGVKMLKELLPLFGALKPKPPPEESTTELVRALAEARILKLDDVVKALEEQLGVRSLEPVRGEGLNGSVADDLALRVTEPT